MAASRSAGGKGAPRPIIIRRQETSEAGHHGGAWKVAYADFVTAMMAFFLLMWLINATTQDQRRGIAAYFSPMAKVENGFSGSGMIPGGAVPVADSAQLVDQGPAQLATLSAHADTSKTDSDGDPDSGPADPQSDVPIATVRPSPAADQTMQQVRLMPLARDSRPDPARSVAKASAMAPSADDQADKQAALAAHEDRELRDAARRLREAVTRDPALAGLGGQMTIDVTPDGLRIQIMDARHESMFASGSSMPTARAKALLATAARYIASLPQAVSVEGYTDAAPYPIGSISNWSLSSGRAEAARAILTSSGLADARLSDVTGYADRKLLRPSDPLSPANRRIVLILHRANPFPAAPS